MLLTKLEGVQSSDRATKRRHESDWKKAQELAEKRAQSIRAPSWASPYVPAQMPHQRPVYDAPGCIIRGEPDKVQLN